MKRILQLAILLTFSTGVAFAQFGNNGFEDWTDLGNGCDEPDEWGSVNSGTGTLGVCTVNKTDTAHSGSSAARLQTGFLAFPFNQVVPAVLTNGTFNVITQAIEGGDAVSAKVESFSGWYQAAPVGGDTYSFTASLTKWNGSSRDTIGTAEFSSTATVATWTEFTADVTYTTADVPDSLIVLITSSEPFNPQQGSRFWVDDITYSLLSGIGENEASLINAYPNPAVGEVTFDLGTFESASIEMFNILGKEVKTSTITKEQNKIDLFDLAAGTYVWQFKSENVLIKTGRLVITK